MPDNRLIFSERLLANEGFGEADAHRVVKTIEHIAQEEYGRVTVASLTRDTPELSLGEVRRVLFLLLESGYFYAKFEPIHVLCGKSIGPPKLSRDAVLAAIENEEYGSICQWCQQYLDDLSIRVQFWKAGG